MSLRLRVLPTLIVAGLAIAAAGSVVARQPHGGFDGKHAAQLDTDGDGNVAVSEVVADAAKRAAAIDADGNGTITAAELIAHQDAQRQLMATKRLERLDANKDGKVSTDEFAAGQSDRVAKLDADGDGVIARSELRGKRHGGRRGPAPEATDAAE